MSQVGTHLIMVKNYKLFTYWFPSWMQYYQQVANHSGFQCDTFFIQPCFQSLPISSITYRQCYHYYNTYSDSTAFHAGVLASARFPTRPVGPGPRPRARDPGGPKIMRGKKGRKKEWKFNEFAQKMPQIQKTSRGCTPRPPSRFLKDVSCR